MQPDDPDSFHVYDTTLRDGTQQEGLSLSVGDKIAVARHLDEIGVGFIEGGWPGSNPKDAEFFRRARTELRLEHALLTAFGATRRARTTAADDPQVAALREAGTAVVCLVAKSDRRHVERALRTTPVENLAMIRDTVAHLRAEGKRVFVDAEHFFDGYRADADYALEVVRVAAEAGAEVVVLCDTNGGMLPTRVGDVVSAVRDRTGARLGIHCHNDTACAVANTLVAVEAGVTHVQGTANGYGERCGNADLFSVVAGLETKLGRRVLPPGRLRELVRVSHAIDEITNSAPDAHRAYVGASAFAHKAGLHASAVKIDPDMYQHIDPAVVGNDMRMLVSELAGRATIELKGRELGLDLSGQREALGRVVDLVKEREAAGYTYEAAEASFELLLRDETEGPRRFFTLESWRVIVERRPDGEVVSEATVKLVSNGVRHVSTAEGNGPVNALDRALREALEKSYPGLADLDLVDYKVRILDGRSGTGAVTRVLVGTSDGRDRWDTVGVDENIIAASWEALQDAVTYGLHRQG
ncbi:MULTISPECIES: citramalate synthase [Protofrankia]|uniref:Citramalate synthase n=1 Tax=Candidatus Protofrankia datiscae TaxID=2716812 RepID=F8AVN8_9ACTN|nr:MULTISPECIES: citramalate synthase [Protofrankia]AEH11018.1 2-isopropylmalate synthase/homocitrate synthase family protein [Candidatus Protofrankia datiscae]